MTSARPLIIKSYLSSLPARINSEEKINALTYFAEGAALRGDQATVTNSQIYEDCDVGAIIGNAFESNPGKVNLSHYKVRKMVMETQAQLGRYWLSIDSNVFIYKDRTNPHRYLRYSFNGVFPATGIYCNDQPGEDNWNNIRRDYGMDLAPWRQTGEHILLCLQRPMGWSMRGHDLMSWLNRTFKTIKTYSDRPIVLRWHPGDWKAFPNYQKLLKAYEVKISPQERHITQDLKNCWALVCHNSTPSSVAVIEGIPAFITDDPGYCQAGAVANLDLKQIENPVMPDREQWIRRLAQCHWSFADLRSGRCWQHMRQYVNVANRVGAEAVAGNPELQNRFRIVNR
jgi:hypothetical protein